MSARDGLAERRLRPHLYESRLGFFLALVVAAVLVLAVSFKARAALDCAGRSVATATASCSSAAPGPDDTGVRVVFSTDALGQGAGR